MAQKDDQPTVIASSSVETKISTSYWEESLKKLIQAAPEKTPTENKTSKPKIQRVPVMLRDHKNFDKYYEPRVVAIGPFHHGKPKYELGEQLKLKLAASFVKDCSDKTNITKEALLRTIEENIKKLRECYDEEATEGYDDVALTWMLFVDGCSMLEFIYKYGELETFKMKKDQVSFVVQDMFLLENQLPYLVLHLLMSVSRSKKHAELKDCIVIFVRMHGVAEGLYFAEQHWYDPILECLSRLICLCWGILTCCCCCACCGFFLLPSFYFSKEDNWWSEADEESQEKIHLLDILRKTMLERPRNNHNDDTNEYDRPRSFRNVQELRAAGIQFRRSEGNSLGNIYFKANLCGGFLYLPRINVDHMTGPKFMNLFAYEMCPDFQNDFEVTSYISFLDSLIDQPDDVKHLRKKRILQNVRGSDEEVAQLFNEIGTNMLPNNKIYDRVRSQIEIHYQSRWRNWMAQLVQEHFRSPWTFLAFIGVLVVLVMTAIQTWYTVYSNLEKRPGIKE